MNYPILRKFEHDKVLGSLYVDEEMKKYLLNYDCYLKPGYIENKDGSVELTDISFVFDDSKEIEKLRKQYENLLEKYEKLLNEKEILAHNVKDVENNLEKVGYFLNELSEVSVEFDDENKKITYYLFKDGKLIDKVDVEIIIRGEKS